MNINFGIMKYSINNLEREINFEVGKTYKDENINLSCIINNNQLTVNIKPKKEIKLLKIELEEEFEYMSDDRIFLNGFQSWTDSKEYSINDKIPRLNKLAFNRLKYVGDYEYYNYTGKTGFLHGWTYSYIRKGDDEIIRFYGSLLEEEGYTLFEHNTKNNKLRIAKECEGVVIYGEYTAFDLIIIEGTEEEVFKKYFDNIKLPEKSNNKSQISGWTSWYNYYTKITEDIIIENLNSFKENKIPIDVFQIDDGYQEYIGDWLNIKDKFPHGMDFIAKQIKSNGYKAGLWLAPFVCEKKSKIYNEHPDWILKDEKGNPLVVGYNPAWSGDFYALDFYNAEVRKYIKEVLEAVLFKWNYDMIKLDFLYAVQVKPRRGKTRAKIMYEAMDYIRRTAKDKIILGCGVPLAPCFGIVDYMRIGCDVNLTWDKDIIPSMTNHREVPSTINALLNTIHRRHLDGNVFGNDPDVFILRKENNKLNEQQKFTLFIINIMFGSLIFTSDNINNYSDFEKNLYKSMFPMKKCDVISVDKINDVYKFHFKIDDREYYTYSNLGNKKQDLKLDGGSYFSNTTYEVVDSTYNIALNPYQSVCVLKINTEKEFEVLGGNGHVFSGCDVKTFKVKWTGNITLELDKDNLNKNSIYIKIPDDKSNYKINGKQYNSENINGFNIIKYNPSNK